MVHLGVEADFRPARKAHPAFRVRRLEDLVERIEASGRSFRWDDELPGVRRGYVDDPFGNRIELIDDAAQPRSPSPSAPVRPSAEADRPHETA
jgi:hypothetical protein